MGLGGFLSNALIGWIAHTLNYNAGFWGLAIASAADGTLYYIKMPETRREEHRMEQGPAPAG